jgi:ATP-binding cassette subfamily B protein
MLPKKIGFRTLGVKFNLKSLEEVPLPCILHWNKEHYVVLYNVKKGRCFISDPGFGLIEYSESDFIKFWIGNSVMIFNCGILSNYFYS